MKFLVIIVSIIVVHTVDGRNSPDNYGALGYGPGETENHTSVETDTEPTFSIQDPYSMNYAHHFYSNQTGHIIQRKSGNRCYASNICNRKGGSCVINAKLCKGRQVPGCKGQNCQCCVPGNQCYTNNICKHKGGSCVSNAKLCRGRLVPGCKGKNCQCCLPGNRCNTNNICKRKGGSCVSNDKLCRGRLVPGCKGKNCQCCLPGNRCNTNNICKRKGGSCVSNDKLCRGRLVPGCKGKNCQCCVPGAPDGFFHTAGSSQYYKYFNDTTRSWIDAKEKCESEGLILAEPADPISLRKYLVETYGDYIVHLGARGTGTNHRWDYSGREISNTDPLWLIGHPGGRVGTGWCLLIMVTKAFMSSHPNQPYYSEPCMSRRNTLCEYL